MTEGGGGWVEGVFGTGYLINLAAALRGKLEVLVRKEVWPPRGLWGPKEVRNGGVSQTTLGARF